MDFWVSRERKLPSPQPSPKGRGSISAVRWGLWVGTVLNPPSRRRVELNGSGAPSGMTAQPQLVQGCTICGVPSDPESEARETAVGGRLGGGGLSFGDFSLATQRKVTRPSPKGGRNLVEDGVLASCVAKPCHQGHTQDWEFGVTPPGSRASEYAALFEPTGPITSLTFGEP